jgi:uncharacterized protein YbcI
VVSLSQAPERSPSVLARVSNAMVMLHKEQFGRGPANVRCHFAGADGMMCILEDVLLPAERKLAAMGEHQRVRESRMAFQVAATEEFVTTVEQIVQRKVRAFSSAVDVANDVLFENFVFAPEPSSDGAAPIA